jgi:hypothetical protein
MAPAPWIGGSRLGALFGKLAKKSVQLKKKKPTPFSRAGFLVAWLTYAGLTGTQFLLYH